MTMVCDGQIRTSGKALCGSTVSHLMHPIEGRLPESPSEIRNNPMPMPVDNFPGKVVEPELVKEFASGATRSSDVGKLDPEGFLSPRVLEEYFHYMHACRIQDDGKLRDSDNWQKGMDVARYMKSLWRHFFAVWRAYRRNDQQGADMIAEVMALLFNTMGLAHELLRGRGTPALDYKSARKIELTARREAVSNMGKATAETHILRG